LSLIRIAMTPAPPIAPSRPPEAPVSAAFDLRVLAQQVLALIDLTRLDDAAGAADIAALCQLAANRHHAPAALCIGLQHVAQARGLLDRLRLSRVAVATVVNFPDGGSDLARVEHEARQALAAGADELDVMLPLAALRDGDLDSCRAMLALCRDICGGQALLKVIIDTRALETSERIAQASRAAIEAGADFLVAAGGHHGPDLSAAEAMLAEIAAHGGRCGFKVAGAIDSLDRALPYLQRAEATLGRDWIGPGRLRFGAAALLHDLLGLLEGAEPAEPAGGAV
jgi:deoxyribose-phosphate aldolase